MKIFLAALVGIISSTALACAQEEAMRSDAVRTLHADSDVARYVCIENGDCGFEEFSKLLEINPAILVPEATEPAIRIEPQRKGRQYFTAFFLREGCKYRLVFAPDVTLSDVKILKERKNGFYMLRATEQDSNTYWKQYDFFYNPKEKQYDPGPTSCYAAHGKSGKPVKCE